MSDKIIRGLAYNGKVSIKCIETTNLVEEARKIHGLSPVATAALGRLLTMGSIMGSNLKDNKDSITLQIKADGPLGMLNVVTNSDLNVKGYVQNPNVDIPLKFDGKLDVGAAVGKNGMLYIIKDIGLKEPYVGLTPLVSGEIAEDFTEYFAKSEQTPAAIALGVLVNKEGVKSAGGYMITLMPDATDDDISKLEENLKNIPPISKLLNDGKDLIEIARIVTGDENIKLLENSKTPKYNCDCSKSRIERGLISLGKEEIQDIIDTDGKAEILCEFCKKEYTFEKEELESLIKEGTANKMKNYIDTLNETIKSYYKILSKDFPEFLNEYINTPAMLKQSKISVSCGTIYSKMYNQMWYSSLDHSIAVSLIIWHFTKDKKQTLAGLFHDIATPVFKHSIDFMNKDYEKQESTEELTTKIIQDSKELMYLLNRDGIKVEEVADYHIYPIADNDTPRLSSDRLEYTLSNGLGATEKFWTLEEVKEIYDNIEIQKDENGIEELGFKDVAIAEKFVHTMSILSRLYIREKTLFTMQLLADIMKKMLDKNLISMKDMYNLSEKEIIDRIRKCNENNIAECFKKWENATEVNTSDTPPEGKYFVNIEKVKKRYINPLVRLNNEYKRIKDISEKANSDINDAIEYKTAKYVFLDFDFE